MLEAGDRIPSFQLVDQNGNMVKAEDFSGKTLVVYFYPKDNTSGCTKEACSFRDVYADIKKAGAAVVGISADTSESHARFAHKFDLPFTLLADPEKTAIKAFGAWGEKKMYGKSYEGILRSTFVIDGQGIVKKVFPKVSPANHAEEVLASL